MTRTALEHCRAAATNATEKLFSHADDRDVIEKVIAYVADRFPEKYTAAAAESGQGTVNGQLAKTVKRTLGASNLGRAESADDAPCKTHTQLRYTDCDQVTGGH